MYAIQETQWVTPNGNPITFRWRQDSSDWNTINSCLTYDEYHLRGRKITQALDVGGYIGTVGVTIAVDNPGARVVIVEPVPPNWALIEANAEVNGVSDRVTVFHGSAGTTGETDTEVWFNHSGNPNLEVHSFIGNTSLAYDHGGDMPHDSLTVPTLGLAALLDRYDLAPDYMKIDCEGGEWAFLDTPDNIRLPYIIGEAHVVRGHKGKDIVDLLPNHDVEIVGDGESTCEFIAVLR